MEKKAKMPLEGIRVIDFTVWQMGPVATRMLASLGAEVIKIEGPDGDPCRGFQRIKGMSVIHKGGRTLHHEMYNSDKLSVTLDLKKPEGREVLLRLVEKSDVFVTNHSPQSIRKMRLDYETLCSHNPMVIYARANGFGFKGPDADAHAMDLVGQARGGFMYMTNSPGEPPKVASGGISDQTGAFIFACGILAALVSRERYGIGQMVETSQLGAMIKLMELPLSGYLFTGNPWPNESRTETRNPLWNWYRCQDGRWIAFAHLRADPYWNDFCTALGIESLVDDHRFKDNLAREEHSKELIGILDETLAKRTSREWLDRLTPYPRLSYSMVNNLEDVVDDPQTLANDYITKVDHPLLGAIKMVGCPLKFSKTPASSFRSMAPELGQHTEHVLVDMLGYSWEEVSALRDKGVT